MTKRQYKPQKTGNGNTRAKLRVRLTSGVFHRAPIGIYHSLRNGTLIRVNRAMTTMLGFVSTRELSRKNLETEIYYDPDERERLIAKHEPQGEAANIEVLWKKKDGAPLWIQMTAHAIKDKKTGKTEYFEGFVQDISERKQAEKALWESENHYRTLVEASHDFITVVNRQWQIEYTNAMTAKQFGLSPQDLIGKRLVDIFPLEIAERQQSNLQKVFESGQPLHIDAPVVFGGNTTWVSTWLVPIKHSGETSSIMMVGRDITERMRALEELESLARFPSENPSPILRVARDGALLYINRAGASLLTDLQLQVGEPVNSYLREAVLQSLDNGTTDMLELECRERSYLFAVAPVIAFRYATLYGIDITDRKRTEGELTESARQLRALAAHLQTIREEERTLVAREIHDQLGQALTGLNMDLSLTKDLLQGKVTPSKLSAISKKLQGMSELTVEAMQLVRKIATQLRPVILDSLGLCSAIDWQVEEFQDRTGIRCKTSLPENELSIDKERSTALFRIFQEALTNIARHTKATEVNVMLARENDAIVLEIQDDGGGIPEKQRSPGDSLGILGMKERALVFGGTVEVHGHHGMGTTVRARIMLT